MLNFEPTAMAYLAQWLQQNGIVFLAGALTGILVTAGTVAVKLIRLRREGVI